MNDLSLHIMDIMQNSVAAGASLVAVAVEESAADDRMTVTVEDNGRGMTPDEVASLGDPFFTSRTTRRVGMGIPLFRQSAEQSGGGLEIWSEPGVGTRVTARMQLSHIDRPPLGPLAASFVLTVSANPAVDFRLACRVDGREWRFDSAEAREALGGVALSDPRVVRMLTEMIENNIADLVLK